MRIVSILTLISQIAIVGTGGAVRLTGSGLGCSQWPNCTPGSFTPTPELGIHGVIEFANRVMGGVVVAIAIAMLVLAIVHRRQRSGVVLPAAIVVVLTLAQALIGAVVVWMHLRPDTVGIHFILSAILVGVATVLAWRVFGTADRQRAGSRTQRILVSVMDAALAVVVFVGILTTGSGPHAGDGGAARNGLDPSIMQHVHAWPAYVLFALAIGVAGLAWLRGPRVHRRFALLLVVVLVLQIVVGLVQSNTGLPVGLVGAHMVLSVIAVAAATAATLGVFSASVEPSRQL